MSAATGELQALRDEIAAYQENEKALLRTILWLSRGKPVPQCQDDRPGQTRLYVIKGGRQ
ncbi:MAG TPA: hypothetical protein VF223_27995 [Trebonia sp.]